MTTTMSPIKNRTGQVAVDQVVGMAQMDRAVMGVATTMTIATNYGDNTTMEHMVKTKAQNSTMPSIWRQLWRQLMRLVSYQ